MCAATDFWSKLCAVLSILFARSPHNQQGTVDFLPLSHIDLISVMNIDTQTPRCSKCQNGTVVTTAACYQGDPGSSPISDTLFLLFCFVLFVFFFNLFFFFRKRTQLRQILTQNTLMINLQIGINYCQCGISVMCARARVCMRVCMCVVDM